MQLDEILIFIYNSKAVQAGAKKIASGTDLFPDLLAELIIIVSEIDLAFLNDLYERKKLEVYCYKIMYYQFNRPNMPFYKQYRAPFIEEKYEEDNIDETYLQIKSILNKIEKEIAKKRYPTEIRLLELYVEHGTYRKVGSAVGISFKTAQYLVKQIVDKIKKEYDISYNS